MNAQDAMTSLSAKNAS